ncbi:M48 family metalloprotease [uncultured Desulfosarcina sp.]|uniref:M48 family metalloprotease n=1 Tax=uncultured Desulfosarcina sp. TaxID=218289 RepID=UPI0029C6C0CE|nr:M48 family metalloprotease [uncultured Desulfosarcina sp.]
MTPHRYVVAWMILMLAWAAPLYALNAVAASNPTPRLWQLAAQEQAMLEQRGIVLHEASLSSYLQTVAERLWKQVSTDLNEPTIKVVMDTRMEAYAYPNGYLFLSTGILNQIENEDQLAMILAHEIVHYVRQHTAVLYDHFHTSIRSTGLSYANQSQAAGGLAMKQKIDAAEYQADDEGLVMLKAAGYCETEVLSLMSNLLKSLQDQGASEAVGQLENRIKTMKTLIGQARDSFPCTSATDGDHYFFLNRIAPALIANAQSALTCGDLNQADRSISKFLVLKPEDARAYYLQGEILRRRNNGDGKNQCIESYIKSLKIDPEFPLAHRALGELYFKAGRFQTAKPYFEAFLRLAPQDNAREFIKGYLRQCRN